jgi:hypothetical protein
VETIAAVVFVVAMAVDATDGVVEANGCTASATTRLASALLGGAPSEAGADAGAEVPVLLPDAWRDAADREVGCREVTSAAVAIESVVGWPAAAASTPEMSGAAELLAVGVAACDEEVESRFSGAAVAASSDVLEPVRAPPVFTTSPGLTDRVAWCGDPDFGVTWLDDRVDISVDPDAVDGAETEVPDTASIPERVGPSDEGLEPDDAVELVDDASEEEDDDVDPDSSADATPHPVITATPIPKATANPPTQPT